MQNIKSIALTVSLLALGTGALAGGSQPTPPASPWANRSPGGS
ncbi:hypothetical protein L1280_001660 [Deinococcus sp. HSC-46F16]|nr:hypothetical protein [Deinococcus sp. HSC-46F16]MCP2014509.1 hypothetical protein [Deinococcus sp. HSC-46F16]